MGYATWDILCDYPLSRFAIELGIECKLAARILDSAYIRA